MNPKSLGVNIDTAIPGWRTDPVEMARVFKDKIIISTGKTWAKTGCPAAQTVRCGFSTIRWARRDRHKGVVDV
jgi:hypothetical protein